MPCRRCANVRKAKPARMMNVIARTFSSVMVCHTSSASTPYNVNAIHKRFTSNPGAQGRIRTSVARKERQIYSLLPLTTRPPVQKNSGGTIVQIIAAPQTTGRAKKRRASAHILRRAERTHLRKILMECVLELSPYYRPAYQSIDQRLNIVSWSWRRELNPRPSDYKSDALPAELRQHFRAPPPKRDRRS